ncbi:hypothetical protein SAMN05660909_05159 [Chitinophaga terrae (ex Kim and Jung 2007)]|uniref:Uncharacterized protein n=1 Tax=Chitinophaga terrae (ex Kim and Jung 2007) TaxID=408074 RepID=A0A1H4GBW8_9BACT|nr:hypothetical protein [Chitinophaga terrae (ex Kim and Jung 2007)]GEP93276.1 hypothetical protein CTE07_49210 [Chitinophaga terrae (ex Kim and Jung 2007)]SEB07099.1 hypothetical protein SAMN05660909_05159 [Chitinophaga terrae (ex Kim and Jung 2007)]
MENLLIEEIIKELKKQGIQIDENTAEEILQFLTEIAEIAVSQYLQDDDSGPIL